MIRYLSLEELLELHRLVLQQTGGLEGLRDLGGLESVVAQPQMTFGGEDLYPCLPTKAAALGFSLVCNHPFLDGNKRVGHFAMEMFLVLNGQELIAGIDPAACDTLMANYRSRRVRNFLSGLRREVHACRSA